MVLLAELGDAVKMGLIFGAVGACVGALVGLIRWLSTRGGQGGGRT